jgi:phage terminase Nu1 subunit (DNA packaging protein)
MILKYVAMVDKTAEPRYRMVVTAAQMSMMAGLSPRRLAQLAAEGMPRANREGYPLAECVRWLAEYYQKRAAPSPLNDARLRKAEAQADAAEFALAAKRKSVARIDTAERVHGQHVDRIRRRILAIGPNVAAALHRAKTVPECETLLRREIVEALTELSGGVASAAP